MPSPVSAPVSRPPNPTGIPTTEEELAALRQQWMEQLFRRADSDRDGKLTMTEFVNAYARFRAQAGASAKLPSPAELFTAADADRDGAISPQEFASALQRLYGQTGGAGPERHRDPSASSGIGRPADRPPAPAPSLREQVAASNRAASESSLESLLVLQSAGNLTQHLQENRNRSVDFTV